MAEVDYYDKLCKYYEVQTGPIPDKDRLKKGLHQTITTEELQVFFFVPFNGSSSLEKIIRKARRLKLSPEEIKSRLDRMHKAAFLIRNITDEGPTYERAFSAYMAEQQVRMRQGTELGQIFAQFWFDLAHHSARNLPTKTPYFRVLAVEETIKKPATVEEDGSLKIEINEAIEDTSTVLPIDIISEMVRKEPLIAVSECYCRLSNRLIGDSCDLTMETCFTFNELAEALIDIGTAREVSADEAVQILLEAEEAGLVHNADNCETHLKALCNCCVCHCPAMQALERGQKNVSSPSRFQPVYDQDVCTLCDICVQRCPMKVITSVDSSLQFDLDGCIGCGLCASGCPEDAIRMVLREKTAKIEKTNDHLWNKLLREAMIGMVKNKLLGR